MNDVNREDDRREHSSEHGMLIQLLDGQNKLRSDMTNQYSLIRSELQTKMADHCADKHKEYDPDHDEQHAHYGSWLKRIDGMWDNAFKAIGLFIMIAIGYGIIVIMKAKGVEL